MTTADLAKLFEFGGAPQRWGGEALVRAGGTLGGDELQGVPVKQLISVHLPAPIPVTLEWGFINPAPALPSVPVGFFPIEVNAAGVRNSDQLRLKVEYGIAGAQRLATWCGPGVRRFVAQELTATLWKMQVLGADLEARAILGLGEIDRDERCVQTFHTACAGIPGGGWTQVLGINYARRGGYVRLESQVGAGAAPEVAFTQLDLTVPARGIPLGTGTLLESWVRIPEDWCGSVWLCAGAAGAFADFHVVEHFRQPVSSLSFLGSL